MIKLISAFCAVILAVAAPLGAAAEEWDTMGPRAMGMGGAGVALAQGPLAAYWNPAALGRPTENSYGLTLPVSVHVALTGPAVEGANDLKNAQTACSGSGSGTAACQAQINVAVAELSAPTNGLRVDGSAAGNLKVGKIDFFLNGFIDAGAVPRVDQVNINANKASAQYIGNNKSSLIVKGAEIQELGAGYGHELPFAPGVFLGGDVKAMRADVGYTDYIIANNTSGESNVFTNLKDDQVTSGNFGVDAGALWDVNKTFENVWWAPRLGVTGRNLNNPKFTQPASAAADGVNGRFAVNPQARAGLAISPFHWWNLAADVDLTRNLTPIDGVASRQLDLGTEVNVFNRSWINIPIRVGFARNTAAASNMVTAGAGLNFLHLIVDVSGEAGTKDIPTQSLGTSKKIPEELGASLSLSLLFGGSEAERAPKEAPVPQYPPSPTAAPAKADNSLTPAQADAVRAHADKAQQDMNKEATQSAPSGK